MHFIVFIIYLSLCYFVAYLGRNRKFRFFGYFILSILLTPIFGLLLVFASDPRTQEASSDFP